MGKYLIVLGALLIVIGTLMIFKVPFSWLGKLPGDYSKTIGNTNVSIPITTCILISILLSMLSFCISFFFKVSKS